MVVWYSKQGINHIMNPTDAKAAIASLQDLINTLMAAAAQAALTGNVKEYSFDDGMTKTKMEYKDVESITASIKGLMALQQIYLQMPGMNPRVLRMISSQNMPNLLPFNCQQ